MPAKTCPFCQLLHRTNATLCECGYDFLLHLRVAQPRPRQKVSGLTGVFLGLGVFAAGFVIRFFLLVVGCSISRWAYLGASVGAVALLLAWRHLVRLPRPRAIASALGFATLALVLALPWNSRDYFLAGFNQVHVGMPAGEVHELLHAYMMGTGIPNFPGVTSIHVGFTSYVNDLRSPSMAPVGCDVYRHSNSGFWNADLGTICYRYGRVTSAAFSPD